MLSIDPAGLRGSGRGRVALACACLVACAGARAAETVSFSVGDDDRVRIEVPSASDRYHVLYYRADAAATEYPVAIHPGREGTVTLTEPLRVGSTGSYRVATFSNSAPGDADGDGTDDLVELGRANPGDRAPLNKAGSVRSDQGATAIPNLATFQSLSYYGPNRRSERHLEGVEYIKFLVLDVTQPDAALYFQNTNTYDAHYTFGRDVLGLTRRTTMPWPNMRGEIIYHPHLVAPNGEAGTFRYRFQSFDRWSFRWVARVHELLAASMPFLRNNAVYHPMPRAMEKYWREKASYDASRVPVYLEGDLGRSVFRPLNAAVGYGLLRVVDGERPTFRDIAILRRLPNELSAVAGVISLQRQTPLSHVNLRAVQDGVPNAYLGNALDDPAVAGLVGRYVRFEVSTDPELRFTWTDATGGTVERAGFSLTEASAADVAAHHAARRPAAAQTPARNLTVTAYRALSAIAFADADAFGVKAANLAVLRAMALADVEVPDGYAVPFHYYDAFMRHNGFYDDVDALLADRVPGRHRGARCRAQEAPAAHPERRRADADGDVARSAPGLVPGRHVDPLPVEHQQRGPAGVQRRRAVRLRDPQAGRGRAVEVGEAGVREPVEPARVRGAGVPPGGPQGGGDGRAAAPELPTREVQRGGGVGRPGVRHGGQLLRQRPGRRGAGHQPVVGGGAGGAAAGRGGGG